MVCPRSRLPVPVGGPVCDTQTDRLIGIAHGSSCPGGRLPGQSAADSSHLYHRSALAPAHRRSITRPPPRLASAYPIGQARHNKRPDYPCTFGHYVDKGPNLVCLGKDSGIADYALPLTSGVSDFGTYIIPNYGVLSEAKMSLWPSGS